MIRTATPHDGVLPDNTDDQSNPSPLIVYYEVTQACDLECRHARASSRTGLHPCELSTREAKRLIDQVAEFPTPPMLGLTGGDLLKRPDVYELIEYATWRGVDVSMTLCATPLVTDAAIHRLRGAGISRLAISLDAGDAMTHDGLWSVPGIFDRTLRILSTARAEGIYTQINTTITPVNFDQVDALANLLAGHQISVWCVVLLVPVGRAAFEPRLSAEQCEQLFEKLWQHTQRQPYAINTTAAPHYRRYVLQHRRHSDVPPFACVPLGMIDGKGVMFIGHTGLIHPSGFMPIVCGLFPLDHLVHVYQRSPIFRGLRDPDRLEGKCHVCEFRKVCGGSRARAYAVTGNPFAQEPDCSYEPMAWK